MQHATRNGRAGWLAVVGVLAVSCTFGPRAQEQPTPTTNALLGPRPDAAANGALRLVGIWDSGLGGGTEIVSVQQSSQRAAVSMGARGAIAILDFSDPRAPRETGRIRLGLADGEELTSVSFDPRADRLAAAIRAAHPTAPGRVELRAAADGALLATYPTGVWPDCVVIDPTGRVAVVANEGEGRVFDRQDRSFRSADGSITLVRLATGAAVQIALTDQTGNAGFVAGTHGRRVEREVDWNLDDRVTAPLDLDGDGRADGRDVLVGHVRGAPVLTDEKDGERFDLPLIDNVPENLEPECVAFTPDGRFALVTLQENNGVVVIDTAQAAVRSYHGLGITQHAADLAADERVAFDDVLVALREPDGIAVTADGRLFVTADEGDTDPGADKLAPGRPAGGGRTLSVFDVGTGKLLGDTGAQLDLAAAGLGVYPDERSGKKGSEPEMVVAFDLDGVPHAAVGLERAGAVVLVSLVDPAHPKVVGAAAVAPAGEARSAGPEGLAWLRGRDGATYVLCANENNGTVCVFRAGDEVN